MHGHLLCWLAGWLSARSNRNNDSPLVSLSRPVLSVLFSPLLRILATISLGRDIPSETKPSIDGHCSDG